MSLFPPDNLRCLESLAWARGRDDYRFGLPQPTGGDLYHPRHKVHYLAGYAAAKAHAATQGPPLTDRQIANLLEAAKVPPEAPTLADTLKTYRDAVTCLQSHQRRFFPFGQAVQVDCTRYKGPGTVNSDPYCPPDGVAVLIPNGNTSWYPLESVHDAPQPERKPLFIPLKAKYFDAFKDGTKTTEYRRRGPRWNLDTCPVGRPVVLSRGYGKQHRLHGVITGCHYDTVPSTLPGWTETYGPGAGDATCITIQLDPTR